MANKRYQIAHYLSGRNDGSGGVDHDMFAQVSNDAGNTWINAAHKTVTIPANVIASVRAAGNQASVVAAYKQAIRDYHAVAPVPLTPPDLVDWDGAALDEFAAYYAAWLTASNAANAAAAEQAQAVNNLVDANFGGFPVHFTL